MNYGYARCSTNETKQDKYQINLIANLTALIVKFI